MDDQVRRELRRLRLQVYVSSAVIAVLALAAFQRAPATPTRFDEISVERINVLNPDGKLSLAISGKGRLPGPTFEGREYPQSLSGGRVTASGMIFFNKRGDEVGGLTYQGDLRGEGYGASAGLTFDQFRQDQVVSLRYSDNGSRRSAGVDVWDRSTEVTMDEVLRIVEARANAAGAARDSIERVIQGLAARGLATHRVFLGSQNRTAALQIQDTRGRPRVRLYVDSADVARLEFLDSAGTVLRALPE